MNKTVFAVMAMALVPFGAFAVDGVVLINQSTVMAAGGFPYTITQPGSYRLTGNLTVPDANTTAILVQADNVTIDLNGFSIIGPTLCTGLPVNACSPTGIGDGIRSSGTGITVTNGTVQGMGRIGINLVSGYGIVEKVRARSNGGGGIVAYDGMVSGSISIGNGHSGIVVNGSTVSGNTTSYNNNRGIDAACPAALVGNTAVLNGGANITTNGLGCAVGLNAAP